MPPTIHPTSSNTMQAPKEGLKGLLQNWHADLLAAFTVALVALPLGLGIAVASDVNPMAGLTSAIIGGIVATVYRGGHLGICGPAAGLIVVVLSTLAAFDGQYEHALGVFCLAGVLQMLFGLLKLGKFTDFFPTSVINGMLGAIGIIIISKQFHIAVGVTDIPASSFDALMAIPNSVLQMNPVVALIAVISIVILSVHAKIKLKFVKLIPAPMWVLLVAIPMAFAFQLHEEHSFSFFGKNVNLGKHLLIQIPDNLFDAIIFPSFEKINEPIFWGLAITVALIASIETLLISKAVDKLDPFRRKTNFNKDLIGVGLASAAAALIGGLPIITVIARSSVNVQNGARTKWSNFYHGLILLLLVIFFERALQRVPMAALAAILVFTGYKLASPKVVSDTYKKGVEQLMILLVTIISTLIYGILWGIFLGTGFAVFIHFIKVGTAPSYFLKSLFRPIVKLKQEHDKRLYLEVGGIANFFSILKMKKTLESLAPQQHIVVGFANAYLVDHTILEYIHDYGEDYEARGGVFDIIGLGKHVASSSHPYSLHMMPIYEPLSHKRFTKRQSQIAEVAKANRWQFNAQISWDTSQFRLFLFFKTRPIEYASNTLEGKFNKLNLKWTISDLRFNEGALLVRNVYHTTLLILDAPTPLPVFILAKDEFIERYPDFKEIHLKTGAKLSKKYNLKGIVPLAVQQLFHDDMITFLLENEHYHIESNGHALFFFKELRFASVQEMLTLSKFAEGFLTSATSRVSIQRSAESTE